MLLWKKYFIIINILALAGVLVTAYLTYQHYKPVGGSFCNVNDYVNCDIVNKSMFADVFGIPVALIGLIAYSGFFIFSFGMVQKWWSPSAQNTLAAMLASISGVLFSLYLTYIEFFILRAVCVMCITQQIIILLIFIFFIFLWRTQKKLRSL